MFAGEVQMSARQLAASDHDKDIAKSVRVGAGDQIAVCLEAASEKTRGALGSAFRRAGIDLVVLDSSELLTAIQR
jgi:hypothetical protein